MPDPNGNADAHEYEVREDSCCWRNAHADASHVRRASLSFGNFGDIAKGLGETGRIEIDDKDVSEIEDDKKYGQCTEQAHDYFVLRELKAGSS